MINFGDYNCPLSPTHKSILKPSFEGFAVRFPLQNTAESTTFAAHYEDT